MGGRQPDELSLLAASLATNYACSALGPRKKYSGLLKRYIPHYKRRVVAIVGSGASQDAGLPSARDLISRLRTPSFPLPRDVIEKELDRLESVHKLDRNQFETCLLAMSATEHSGKVVREKLVDIYDRRFIPTLTYEILAHLLKHKFLDAIISFNFDELLDQAISDELNPSEYHFILSDGDCPPSRLVQDKVLEKPFYIKPHGTVSHSSTLRFTRDDYYRLPLGIQRLIGDLLTTLNRPVDLISIGFDMKSFEFNHIVRNSQQGSRVFYVNRYAPEPDPPFGNKIKSHLIKVHPRSLDTVLGNLLEKTYGIFKKPYTPRGIRRHRVLARLFRDERKETPHDPDYLWDRTVIELALAIAKTKGFVTMSGLTNGRTGKYFRRFQTDSKNHGKRLQDLCRAIGLNDLAYGYDVLRLGPSSSSAKILSETEFISALPLLIRQVKSQLSVFRHRSFDLVKSDFKKTLIEHYYGPEVEVRAASEVIHDNLFKNPRTIRSKTALDYFSMQLLKNNKWRTLLLVSETGEWLTSRGIKRVIGIRKFKRRKIGVIVADPTHEKTLRSAYGKQVKVLTMPWWEHNRHLTLFLDGKDKATCAIYFTRLRRGTDVVPVYVEAFDAKTVYEIWKAYWLRATKPGVEITRRMIQKFKLADVFKIT